MDDLLQAKLADVGAGLADTGRDLLQRVNLRLEDVKEAEDLFFDRIGSLREAVLGGQRVEENSIAFEFGDLQRGA